MTKRTEKKLADLLPQAIEEKLASHVRPIVEKELQMQLGSILSQEQLAGIIQPLLSQTLPSLLKQEIISCEPIIRQTVSDLARTPINESLTESIREYAETGVRKYLSDSMREHLDAMNATIKDEIQKAVLIQAPLLADDIVRATAEQTVEQAVQRIMPELAEQHIKAELKRLTDADEAPNAA